MKKLFLALALTGCTTMSREELQIVKHIEIPKYMGTWYVIANIPLPLEGDLVNATETYTWNEKEDRIDIDYRGRKKTIDGELKQYPQKGFIHDKETNADWRVQFIWPLKFSYLIQEIADDYSYTIVGVPSKKYIWIMGRKPSMNEKTYEMLVAKAQALGYDISKLKKVTQQWPEKN